MRPKPILKYVGLGLLLLGTILNILMFLHQPYPTYLFFIMMAVGLLLFVLSLIFKKLNTWWQFLISLIPFIATYILFAVSSPSKDIFLIPKGYTGKVTIYYDQPNGQKEEFENGWRIYRIPPNEQLKTQFKLKGNSINLSDARYFYVDSNNKRVELKHYCDCCQTKDTISLQVVYGVLGTNENGTYQDFYIGRPMDIKNIQE
ncbi:MAG TPA: hypothetical protein VK705_06535 [Ferruginibacter sp.]|jgi:hypothetical protein|nr:hypothetical protein [Ferruginibacter sp.]